MSDFRPLTPLGAHEPRTDTHGPVTLTEVVDTALASCSSRLGHEAQVRSALQDFLGFALPEPGQSVSNDPYGAFWMGPDQWMICAPHGTHEDLAAQIKEAVGETASVTEQNDAWCRFDLTGDHLPAVFERLCAVDLRSGSGGEATRTSIDHLGCFLVMTNPDHVRVLGPRSSAGSLHHALLTAMRSAL
ncbi:sarcosine oxidase subunit gamma [Thalassococcus lentus]|uniref:Sarcosine oxidase subunit gamma n=1 Tax=Thalassococcus lentus TaxID=1210524 RepID=A0ABT4XSL1_9RHOB|nr:sarcosine oxidase subunit gamma [Thalassococcus lentus]MDA7424892.1 sarcosine oxidase subunit gamma [Thalassococcus lentus]